MSVDHGDARQEVETIQRRLKALETGTPQRHSDDAAHLGSGTRSIQLGTSSTASGQDSTALGSYSTASDDFATAIGTFCEATNQNSIAMGIDSTAAGIRALAVGQNANAAGAQSAAFGHLASAGHDQSTAIGDGATTTAINQIRLGTSSETVSVPGNLTVTGTFSNPSARRLKRNIIPAPDLRNIFPELVEYEYIDGDGRRRTGYIADDLVGTDAERFVQLDSDGRPSAIDYLGLLIAQVARLNDRITELESEGRNG